MAVNVRIENLYRHFGNVKAVDGVSFSFTSGDIFGFIGPNGAGKTTTMRILATLDEPTHGDVYLGDFSLVEEPEKARRMIGWMPDSLPSHRDMSVHDYLDFFARAYGLKGTARKRMVERIEDFTNLMGIRHKMLNALSKGMKQRVSLARAIVHDPPILVMDEPAAGLDPRARVELRELLRVLADQGKAILISSHILTELAEIVNGAVIIEHGKILRSGTLHDLARQDTPHRAVLIRSVDHQHEEIYKELLQMPNVETAKLQGREVEARIIGDEEVCADLLTALVQKGFRIVEFHQQKVGLEQVFMSVTKGTVQ